MRERWRTREEPDYHTTSTDTMLETGCRNWFLNRLMRRQMSHRCGC